LRGRRWRATPESAALRRLQLRFPEPELEQQFLLDAEALKSAS